MRERVSGWRNEQPVVGNKAWESIRETANGINGVVGDSKGFY